MARQRRKPLSLEAFVVVEGGLARVRNLISLYDHAVKTIPSKRLTPVSDLLRAAVVLLHAVLEDFVRHVVGSALPEASSRELVDIPFPGHKRGTKFTLGDLSRYRGMAVEELIALSVREHVDKSSFSSMEAIVSTLRAAGVPRNALRIREKALSTLIDRRHQIVHQADQVRDRRLRSSVPRAMSKQQVLRWVAAVDDFVREVDREWKVGRWSRT